MIEVELPDGRIVEIETDDPAQAASAAKNFLSKSPVSAGTGTNKPEPPMVPGGTVMPEAPPPMPQTPLGSPSGDDFASIILDAATKAPPPPTKFSAGGALTAATQGLGRAAIDTIGFVPDMLESLYNVPVAVLNRGNPNPIFKPMEGYTESLADAAGNLAGSLGFPVKDPATMPLSERAPYEATRFATGGALFGGLMSRASQARTAALGPRIERTPRMFDPILAPYEKNPVAAVVQDTAAGFGSGTALAGADAMSEDGDATPLAKLTAMLMGGVGGATGYKALTAPTAIPRAIKGAMPAYDVPYIKIGDNVVPINNNAADRAATFYQGNLSDPKKFAEDVTTGAAEFKDAGMPVPPVGTLSNDLGAIAMESVGRTRDPRPFMENDAALRTAATDTLKGVRPDVPEANARLPQQVAKDQALSEVAAAEASAQSVRDQVAKTTRELEDAQSQVNEVVGPYRTTEAAADQADASRRLDKVVVEGTLAPKTAEKNAAFDAADPDGTNMRDASPLIESARKVREGMNALTTRGITAPEGFIRRLEAMEGQQVDVPAQQQTFKVDPQGVSERVAGRPADTKTVGGKVSVKDLNETRRDITAMEKKARQQGDLGTADNLRALRNNIDAEFDRMIAKNEAGGQEIAEAREIYRERYAPFFGQGAGKTFRDSVQKDDLGRTATPPERTAEQFLGTSADKAAASQDLARIISASTTPAEGTKAVRDYLVAAMAKTLGVDGKPSLKALQKWRSDWSANLDAYPTVKAEVDEMVKNLISNRNTQTQLRTDLDTFAADLRKAEGDVAATKKRVGEGVLSVLIGNEPKKAAAKILNSADPEMDMRDVLAKLKGNNDALEAFKANVTDYMIERVSQSRAAAPGGDDAVSYAAMKKFFESKKATLQQVYSPDEMNALQRVQKLLEPLTKQEFRGTVGSPTAERNEQAWRTLEAGLKAYYGVLKGGGVLRTMRLFANTIPDNTEAVQIIIGKAMFDPKLASHLATRNVNIVDTPQWNAKLNRLLGYGEVARSATGGANKKDDKKN